MEKARFYAELMHYGEARNYQPGWAKHKFRERFGFWPPFAWNDLPRFEPSTITARWIKSRIIAYARARRVA